MRYLRCVVARWLRRQADRLDPPPQITVRLQADDTAFRTAMENAEQQLRRATQSRIRRQPQWPDPPPPQPNMGIVTGPEKRSPS